MNNSNNNPFGMRIALGALCAAALTLSTGSAVAQSSVTLAGRVDVGVQHQSDGNVSRTGVDSGGYTASRLIFRGTEDLGGGLKALFYLENGFNADTGVPQSASKFFNRGSYVGLSSASLGQVTLGRQYMPIFWPFLFADDTGPLRLHNYSAVQSVQRGSFARVNTAALPRALTPSTLVSAPNASVRQLGITSAFEDNSIVYKSPVFANTTVMLALALPEGYATGDNAKVYGANIESRPLTDLYLGAAFNQKRGKSVANGDERMNEYLVSGMYAITKEFKVWGNYHAWNYRRPATQLSGRDAMLGLSYWMPQGELWINFAAKRLNDCADCGVRGFGIGYQHFLSKRTELYAAYGLVDNKLNSLAGLNGLNASAGGRNVRGVVAGIAHQF